jgi:hypothetical protein
MFADTTLTTRRAIYCHAPAHRDRLFAALEGGTVARVPVRRAVLVCLPVVIAAIVLSSNGALSAGAQQNLPTKPPTADPKDASPWPATDAIAAAKRAADHRPLFASTELLAFSLVADFGQVQRDRETENPRMYPATIVVADGKGGDTSIPVRIRTRGHSRRKPDACTFAPLRIEFGLNPVNTVFEGQKTLKLGVHCREAGEYPQYVVREYPAYRMFNLLTPRSFRARLAEARYVDVKSKKTIGTRGSLFIEDDDDVARRLEGRISDTTGLYFSQLEATTTTMMMMFEYMIGNTDLSIRSLHNMRVVLTRDGQRIPVPYDFDYAGLVNAAYAAPNPLVRLSTVRERLYMGPCQTPAVFDVFAKRFLAARPQLLAVYDDLPHVSPKYASDAKKYLEGFFRTIETPGGIKRAFINGCDGRRSN